jgi:hypothetical protein
VRRFCCIIAVLAGVALVGFVPNIAEPSPSFNMGGGTVHCCCWYTFSIRVTTDDTGVAQIAVMDSYSVPSHEQVIWKKR